MVQTGFLSVIEYDQKFLRVLERIKGRLVVNPNGIIVCAGGRTTNYSNEMWNHSRCEIIPTAANIAEMTKLPGEGEVVAVFCLKFMSPSDRKNLERLAGEIKAPCVQMGHSTGLVRNIVHRLLDIVPGEKSEKPRERKKREAKLLTPAITPIMPTPAASPVSRKEVFMPEPKTLPNEDQNYEERLRTAYQRINELERELETANAKLRIVERKLARSETKKKALAAQLRKIRTFFSGR